MPIVNEKFKFVTQCIPNDKKVSAFCDAYINIKGSEISENLASHTVSVTNLGDRF